MFIKKLVNAFRMKSIRDKHLFYVLAHVVLMVLCTVGSIACFPYLKHPASLALAASIFTVGLLLGFSDAIERVLWQYDDYQLRLAYARQRADFEARLLADTSMSEERRRMAQMDFDCGDRPPLRCFS